MDTLSLYLGTWCQPQFGTCRSLGSGPGPDTPKQLAARDGYLTAVSQLWNAGLASLDTGAELESLLETTDMYTLRRIFFLAHETTITGHRR